MRASLTNSRLLALYPNSNGLCYALFEHGLRPVDWGIKTARQRKHTTVLRHATWLLTLLSPSTIILPARVVVAKGSRRLQEIANGIDQLSIERGLTVHWYTRADIKTAFAQVGANSKDAIAAAIANLLPEFEQHRPPVRKLWMSEDYRMGIFDAVALALTDHIMTKSAEIC